MAVICTCEKDCLKDYFSFLKKITHPRVFVLEVLEIKFFFKCYWKSMGLNTTVIQRKKMEL